MLWYLVDLYKVQLRDMITYRPLSEATYEIERLAATWRRNLKGRGRLHVTVESCDCGVL